jgi:hypothetical protein
MLAVWRDEVLPRLAGALFPSNPSGARFIRRPMPSIQRFGLGRIPGYPTRYLLAQDLLSEKDPNYLGQRFNKEGCKDGITAMLLAPVAQDSKGRIQKVKASERKESFPAEHATHYTDNIDLHFLSCGTAIVNAQVDFSQFGIFST